MDWYHWLVLAIIGLAGFDWGLSQYEKHLDKKTNRFEKKEERRGMD